MCLFYIKISIGCCSVDLIEIKSKAKNSDYQIILSNKVVFFEAESKLK